MWNLHKVATGSILSSSYGYLAEIVFVNGHLVKAYLVEVLKLIKLCLV